MRYAWRIPRARAPPPWRAGRHLRAGISAELHLHPGRRDANARSKGRPGCANSTAASGALGAACPGTSRSTAVTGLGDAAVLGQSGAAPPLSRTALLAGRLDLFARCESRNRYGGPPRQFNDYVPERQDVAGFRPRTLAGSTRLPVRTGMCSLALMRPQARLLIRPAAKRVQKPRVVQQYAARLINCTTTSTGSRQSRSSSWPHAERPHRSLAYLRGCGLGS